MIEDTGIDRLSALPDDILHYILSLIHTKFSVRTSILSRRWISLWKYVPVLAFCVRWSGVTRSEHYVDRVLSLRSDSIDVNKVTVDFWSVSSRKMDVLLDRITKYAASHGVQELFIRTRSRSPSLELDVIGSVCSCYRSLKVLELGETYFRKVDYGSWSCLQMLESLTLWKCWIDLGDATLTQFPRLEFLKLFKCVNGGDDDSKVLKVIAPELLNLDIVLPDYYAWDLEIVTPKLQSFTFQIGHTSSTKGDLSKSNLPSLHRANIKLLGVYKSLFDDDNNTFRVWNNDAVRQREIKALEQRCLDLFNMLHNVEALRLEVQIIEVLIQVCNSRQSSPFKKLKSLDLKCREKSLDDAPDQVVSYFLGSSPNKEEETVWSKKLC